MNTKAGPRRKDLLTLSSNEKVYHAIFTKLQTYQREYNRAAKKKTRQVKTLQEIDSKGTARVINDIERQFDEKWMIKKKFTVKGFAVLCPGSRTRPLKRNCSTSAILLYDAPKKRPRLQLNRSF